MVAYATARLMWGNEGLLVALARAGARRSSDFGPTDIAKGCCARQTTTFPATPYSETSNLLNPIGIGILASNLRPSFGIGIEHFVSNDVQLFRTNCLSPAFQKWEPKLRNRTWNLLTPNFQSAQVATV